MTLIPGRARVRGIFPRDLASTVATAVSSPTLRKDGHAYFAPETSFARFAAKGEREMERARGGASLGDEREANDATLHATVLPWVRFTSFTNAMRREDSVPKLTFGKRYAEGGAWYVPVCVEVHHALVDGIDVGDFFERFQDLLARPPSD